jgi:uncharacterized ion transporter superfamily protein YfcC
VSNSRFRVPHTLVLLFSMVLVAQLLTWVLPQGEFQREVNEAGREEVVAGTYAQIEGGERGPWHKAFTAIPDGFAAAHDIIFFVFLVGGAFAVLRRTGAIDSLIAWLLERFEGRPNVLIAGGVFLFAAGSSTIGMAEEYMPFVPVLLILARGMGFDAVTAVGILCIGYGAGYGAAAINPFTVLIAQDVAGLQPVSGLGYRLVLFVIFVAVGIHHVASYAKRVASDPSRSLMDGVVSDVPAPEVPKTAAFSGVHKLVLAIMVASIALLVWGIKEHHWYLNEMGALFLGLSLVLILITRMGLDTGAREFCAGAAELTTTALLIGFAGLPEHMQPVHPLRERTGLRDDAADGAAGGHRRDRAPGRRTRLPVRRRPHEHPGADERRPRRDPCHGRRSLRSLGAVRDALHGQDVDPRRPRPRYCRVDRLRVTRIV